jgi:hypothetical protein
VVEQLWNGFADLGELERHVIDNGELTAEQTTDLVAERLRAGTLSA